MHATANAWRSPFGEAIAPSIQAALMQDFTSRYPVVRENGQIFSEASKFLQALMSRRRRSFGMGILRKTPFLRRLRVSITTLPSDTSKDEGWRFNASLIRQPV